MATSTGVAVGSVAGIVAGGAATRPPSPRPNFTPAAQNDFAARVKWSVTPTFAGANHEPTVTVAGRARITARPGDTVHLEATASDPDGNAVSVKWWRWKEVDTYRGDITIADSTSLTPSFRIPTDASAGQVIQIVVEATDDGRPALTRYQRVVVLVE